MCPLHGQLLTVQSVNQFCTHSIDGIKFYFRGRAGFYLNQIFAEFHSLENNTVPCTLSHHFGSEAIEQLKFKSTSLNETCSGTQFFPSTTYILCQDAIDVLHCLHL